MEATSKRTESQAKREAVQVAELIDHLAAREWQSCLFVAECRDLLMKGARHPDYGRRLRQLTRALDINARDMAGIVESLRAVAK